MLNAGLLLRKPGESAYGQFSRFLIANQSIDLSGFRDEFRKDNICIDHINISDNSEREGWLTKYARKHEENYIEKHSISKQKVYLRLYKGY